MEPIALDAQVKTAPCSLALEWKDLRPEMIKSLVGMEGDVLFTSSGAEAVCQVLWSVFFDVARKQGKTHFITSPLEEGATLRMLGRLEELGCFVKMVKVNGRGEIDLDHLDSLIGPRTALVSLSAAQGWTGVIQPVEEIAQLAQKGGALFHLDATHAVGKMGISCEADYVTFSGDCIHSIPGTGAVVAKTPFASVFEFPCNDPAAMALCAAAHQASLFLDNMSLDVAHLKSQLEQKLGAEIAFEGSLRLPNTSVLFFENVHAEALVYFLQRKGIAVEIGPLVQLLKASGYKQEKAETAVSISLSRMTTEEEVVRAAEMISGVAKELQRVSCEA